MSLHKEVAFEDEICAGLSARGWISAGAADWQGYDRARALYPADLVAWFQETDRKSVV